MTTEYSIQKMVSDGTLSTIALGIQYLQRNDIYMRIAGVDTPQSGAPSGYTWSFIDNTTLKILPVVPNGVEVVVYRRTDTDTMYNVYSQNAQFDESTIDENNQQLLYIAQEYLEQGVPGAGVESVDFIREDGTLLYYRIRLTDGSYTPEFVIPRVVPTSFKPATFDFASGGVLTAGERNLAVFNPPPTGDSNWYSFLGEIPSTGYMVVPGMNPIGSSLWQPVTDLVLSSRLGIITKTVALASDIPAGSAIGSRVRTLGKYLIGKGAGEYVITSGISAYPLVDPQIASDRYAKLLPLFGTNYNYSLLAAGGKNDLTIDGATSIALNQLLAKIWAESPVIGGLVKAEGGQYFLNATVSRPVAGCKNLGIVGEYSPLTYGTYESKTIFYFGNSITGSGYAFDFFESQYITLSDFALRGDVNSAPTTSGIRLGKEGTPQASGYANHLLERLNVTHCYDCILMKNSGISTLRDIQVAHFVGRGVTLVTSGDSNLYNIYANDGNKDTTEASIGIGTGVYVGLGSNNVNVFGGKLEYNSKGFVSHGSNGVSLIGIQFDYNKMANHIVQSIDDGTQACRGNTSVGCRYLSGGVVAGYQKASIYVEATSGSASLSISGGSIQLAGDGAYDASTSGVIGPQIGVYAKGNSTYSLDVIGAGLVLDSPGLTYAAVADGFGVRVKLSGTGGKKTVQELNGGRAHVGFYAERSDEIAFLAPSGSAVYFSNSCDTVVVDGIATMDLVVQLTANSGLTGNVTIGLLPYVNTGVNAAAVTFAMISSINYVHYGMLGLVYPGDNKVTLYKRNSDGTVALLQGTDLGNNALLRMSLSMKVA